ncbi:contact-dependent growth inhibition system immunity protein [Alicyclobacillus cellulosilyticus]|nr:contact-dependent growth inhibition system immunity protein [Alicyclobacillus cellulosilyticus]
MENLNHLKDFLVGYWHMDVESTESGLKDVFKEMDKDAIQKMVLLIDRFLGSTDIDEDKIKFIEYCTDVYYPDMEPIQWLKHIREKLYDYVVRH